MNVKVPCQAPSQTPCKIAFVGEAPSDEEVAQRRPLVGPSGRVFNAMLRNADIDRDQHLVTNVFDEQAEDNDVSEWMKDPVRCAENFARLNEEITRFKPTVIVPMGNTALWAFTEQTLIGKFRGAVCTATRISEGHKLIPSYHPMAVQRDWRLLVMTVMDFVKAAKEAELGPQVVYPKVQLIIEPTVSDVEEFTQQCVDPAIPKLAVDIETGWGQVTAISFAPSTTVAMSIPFVDLRKPNKSYWPTARDELRVWKLVKQVCETSIPKVGQNYLYDLSWLWVKHGVATRNYRYDTRLRHKVMYPELPADLASMAASYTRLGAWKTWGGKYQKDTKTDG